MPAYFGAGVPGEEVTKSYKVYLTEDGGAPYDWFMAGYTDGEQLTDLAKGAMLLFSTNQNNQGGNMTLWVGGAEVPVESGIGFYVYDSDHTAAVLAYNGPEPKCNLLQQAVFTKTGGEDKMVDSWREVWA